MISDMVTKLLGETKVSKLPFVQPDDSTYILDKDYSGKNRNKDNQVTG
jgi:hypothetical protein